MVHGVHRWHGQGPEPDFYVNFLRARHARPELCDMVVTLVAKGGHGIAERVIPPEDQEEIAKDPVWVALNNSGTPENICAYLFPVEYSRVRRRAS